MPGSKGPPPSNPSVQLLSESRVLDKFSIVITLNFISFPYRYNFMPIVIVFYFYLT